MNLTLGSVTLDHNMVWTDEFKFNSIVSTVDYTVGGVLEIQQSNRIKGRPITLASDPDAGFLTRQQVIDTEALANVLSTTYVLTLPDTRTFNVQFDFSNGPAIEAEQVFNVCNPALSHYYRVTIKLIEV